MQPDSYTIAEHFLDVGGGHTLYIQDWGNKKAKKTIVSLHGGPGSASNDGHKDLFDPTQQRVIFFHQRGCGRSLPYGSLEHNTTKELVEDIEKIARHLKLNAFVVTGGSWGSCLAFAYALKYPKRVEAMVLRGIFTGSKEEIDYLDKGGFRLFYPDVWETYLQRTPEEHHADPSKYHYQNIKSSDDELVKKSSFAYSELEGALLRLDDRHRPQDYETFDDKPMKIELHYLEALCFMPDNYILDNAHRIKTRTWLVQGRYDIVCPPKTAHEMHKRLPNSQLLFSIAGHSGNDRGTFDTAKALLLQLTT